ncbi:MAG TPA: BglII/BstYI family type II restriction endonuclease [Edaphobacter sp.]|nr:BglII/BstYI family type II restriction endonuclease [Edaphobacter sp.]
MSSEKTEITESDSSEEISLDEEISSGQVAEKPNDVGDPSGVIEKAIPRDIRERYDVYSYRNAAVILSETRSEEFGDLLQALRNFQITTKMIRTAGGNESDIPKLLSNSLRPLGWHETVVQGDLHVKRIWREQVGVLGKGKNKGKPKFGKKEEEIKREKYLDGHKIDYVKGRVAFDLEWNSKDQTFDRDLYAFSAFFQCGVIDVGVLVTRSKSLDEVFKELGQALKRDGETPDFTSAGKPRPTSGKFGASTTWVGKLLYRLNAGRNGGCPVLVLGITPRCISDWPKEANATEPLKTDSAPPANG